MNIKLNRFVLCAFILLTVSTTQSAETFTTEPFKFTDHRNQKLDGIISRPLEGKAKSILIVVHGYGSTNVVKENHYQNFRSRFTEKGITVVIWDKPGNGNSEGEFDINQPIESSAQEIHKAIEKLRISKEPGYKNIGLWGGSRAGWIAPVAIQEDPSIKFWISLSGPNAYENWGYLLRSSLEIANYSNSEIDLIYNTWIKQNLHFNAGGNYEEYLIMSEPFRSNEIVQKLTNQPFVEFKPDTKEFEEDKKQYYINQKKWMDKKPIFDKETGLQIVVPEFEKVLNSISCPVLALFGNKDKNIDWKKTKSLYENTIGSKPDSKLTIKVFENADHGLRMSKTGGYLESQQKDYWKNPVTPGYYEVMFDWLCSQDFCK